MTPEENTQRIADLETRLLERDAANLALVQSAIAAQAKAADVLAETVNRVPRALQQAVAQMTDLVRLQFEGVQNQFVAIREAALAANAATTKQVSLR